MKSKVGGTMKLSQIQDEFLSDEEIQKIVYSDIQDCGLSSKYGLVFGNSMLIQERVSKAVELYQQKRVEKLLFMGGVSGVSNQTGETVSEAERMKDFALSLGVREEDILLDTTSNNTFENVDHALSILKEELSSLPSVSIITSEFHLKRCYAILKKKCPRLEVIMIAAKDGFTDSDNWFLSDNRWNSGRSLATYEAHLLVRYAREHQILDLDIPMEEKKI